MFPQLLAEVAILVDDDRNFFARECCRLAFDEDRDFPMHADLLREVIIPYLVIGFKERRMPHLLWLAKARKQVYAKFIEEQIGKVNEIQLLILALEVEPKNAEVAKMLTIEAMDYLDYISHEMPYCYICPLEDVSRSLERVRELVIRVPDPLGSKMREFYRKHRKLYEAWCSWESAATDASFKEWCDERGVEWNLDSWSLQKTLE